MTDWNSAARKQQQPPPGCLCETLHYCFVFNPFRRKAIFKKPPKIRGFPAELQRISRFTKIFISWPHD